MTDDIQIRLFRATRGELADYADGTHDLKALVLNGTYIHDPDATSVGDIADDEITGGTYARIDLTDVSWNTTGDLDRWLANDLLFTGLDVEDPDAAGAVVIYDADDGKPLASVTFAAVPVVGDLPIVWPGGTIASLGDNDDDLTDLDARVTDHETRIETLEGGGAGGAVVEVQAGSGITVDATDPQRPVVTATGGDGDDSALVHLAGAETITGTKTFTAPILVSTVIDPGSDAQVDVGNQELYDASGQPSLDWTDRELTNAAGTKVADWTGSGVDFPVAPTVPNAAFPVAKISGLGTAATKDVGTTSSDVAIGTTLATAEAYADTAVANAVAGWTAKQAVRVVATTNLSLTGAATIDGVAVATGDRVLASAQSTGSQNGIYRANTAGAWTRTTDADTSAEVFSGIAVAVTAGTTYIRTFWVLTTADPITLGTTSLTFSALAVPVQSVFGRTGAVTAQSGDYTTATVPDSTDKRYVTDAQSTVIGNTSGTNTGDATTTSQGALFHGATSKTTPVDADEIGLVDSAASNVLKKLTFANLKAALRSAFGIDSQWQTISRSTLAVDTASLSFNTTGYSMIRIRIVGRNTDTGSTALSVRMTCNNDTGSNYSTGTGALTTFLSLGSIPASQTNTTRTGFIDLNFNYLASSWSTGGSSSTAQSSTASTGGAAASATLAWTGSTSNALTSIQLFPVSSNFAAGMQVFCEGLI